MAFTRREIGLGALAVAAVGGTAIGFRLIGGRGTAVAGTFEVTHTPEEWRKLLSPEQYAVLREQDTERAFTSPLNKEHRTGTFICAGCDLPLFSSKTKFDSGTGWPSFYEPIEGRGAEGQRLHLRHGAGRGSLPPLRGPSRPCVQRRPAADRLALLHQRRLAEIRGGLASPPA